MSLQRHGEIYPYDEGTTQLDRAPAHRLDEFPAGYSWRGALQHGPLPLHQPTPCCIQNQYRSTRKQRMANHGLTSCLSPGVHFSYCCWCVVVCVVVEFVVAFVVLVFSCCISCIGGMVVVVVVSVCFTLLW
jgi:hypothetical protein